MTGKEKGGCSPSEAVLWNKSGGRQCIMQLLILPQADLFFSRKDFRDTHSSRCGFTHAWGLMPLSHSKHRFCRAVSGRALCCCARGTTHPKTVPQRGCHELPARAQDSEAGRREQGGDFCPINSPHPMVRVCVRGDAACLHRMGGHLDSSASRVVLF